MLWMSIALASPAADAVAAGDCTQAVIIAPADDSWRLPRAWCLLKLGQPEAALKELEVPLEGVLGEYAQLVKARAQLALKQDEAAMSTLEGLKLPGDAGDEVRATLAEIYARRGEVSRLQALSGLEPPARAAYLKGLALKTAKRDEEATKVLQQVWRDAAVGGWDAQAKALLPDWTPTLADNGARLKALRKAGRIDEAAALSKEIGEAEGPPLEMARVNLQAREYATSLIHWERALGKPKEAIGPAQSLFDYALTWARTGDYETAAVVYERVLAQHPGTSQADFASYKLGYMPYDKGDCARATPLFEAHLKRYPRSEHATEALWFAARCAWRVGEVPRAETLWNQLLTEHASSDLAPGAVYWLARARGVRGDRAGETAGLERVLKSWPVSGYAWFATVRLGKTFPHQDPAERPPWPKDLAARKDVGRAEALLTLGLRSWARDELAPVASVAKSKEAALAAAWAFLEAGDYRRAQQLVRPWCSKPWSGGDPLVQQACVPQPERAIVDAVTERFDLDPYVPYGIMTAESALKPWVTSRAGARGLMQLMPKEGPRIHAELYPERPYDADDLYSAPYNASMGTAELGLRRQSLKGVLQQNDLPAVIASYNGGEEAVRRWLKAYDHVPEFDEFAEDVGYTETRQYVKRVLGYVMTYRWTYGDPE